MKYSVDFVSKEVFPGSEIVRKFAFKITNVRDNCALFTIVSPVQTADFALTRGKSAHLQKTDCFECLSSLPIIYREAA